MEMLRVEGLCKRYEKFSLEDVSFTLDGGYIMGFLGRNGAGKTTTIKSMLGLVHPDKGNVFVMGHDIQKEELYCRSITGIVLGGFNYYKKKKLKTITDVTKKFYPDWDDKIYKDYMDRFSLDDAKTVEQLSEGMKVKYALVLALSHNAKLMIFDEPTSGLDPVSREDLLDVFRSVIEDGERSILFSTQITSDLEKCADYITYIKDGRIIASEDKITFTESHTFVSGKKEQLEEMKPLLIGYKENAFGFTGLLKSKDVSEKYDVIYAPADLESIMIYTEREGK